MTKSDHPETGWRALVAASLPDDYRLAPNARITIRDGAAPMRLGLGGPVIGTVTGIENTDEGLAISGIFFAEPQQPDPSTGDE